ncbi:hypothetical protein LXA43DRAFT_1098967 [Ganoderma leucocontextum]|nr:hypothetical protein LXA43DRAFT_1098967 [Ganoderma leucocontextum]
MKVVDAYLQLILEEAVRKNRAAAGKTEEGTEESDSETLMDHLVKQTEDPTILHDETLNIMIAGRDTQPVHHLPFNGGPRICLGQQFAYNEMSFFLICLLKHFLHMDLNAQPADARPPPEWANEEGHRGNERIILPEEAPHVGGLWVKMTEADRDA